MKSNSQTWMVCLALALAAFILLVPSPATAQQSGSAAPASPSTPQVPSAAAHTGKTAETKSSRISATRFFHNFPVKGGVLSMQNHFSFHTGDNPSSPRDA
jgi:hypothetical protein